MHRCATGSGEEDGSVTWGHSIYAGGVVVHITAGTAALVAAIVLGPRTGFGIKPFIPHNLTLTVMGAGMLWVG